MSKQNIISKLANVEIAPGKLRLYEGLFSKLNLNMEVKNEVKE